MSGTGPKATAAAPQAKTHLVGGVGERGQHEDRHSCASGPERSGVIQRCAADGDSGCSCGVEAVLRSPGEPLEPTVRSDMEARFGIDFSRVRIHTDPDTAASAQWLGVHAYTVGMDIAFASGRHAPRTSAGIHLLAHELAHVTQQASMPAVSGLTIVPADSPLERHADRIAGEVVAGRSVLDRAPIASRAAIACQRSAGLVAGDPRQKIERINSLLSYGIFDWTITDREAVEALALLRSMSQRERTVALRQIDAGRLMDNIPRRYQVELAVLLVASLPPNQVAQLISQSLETPFFDVFDWFVTEDDAVSALNMLEALPSDQRDRVFDGLGLAGRGRLWRALPDEQRARADRLWEERQRRIFERQRADIERREQPRGAGAAAVPDPAERKRQEFMRWIRVVEAPTAVDDLGFDIHVRYVRWVEQHVDDPEYLTTSPDELYDRVAATVRQARQERREADLDVQRRQEEVRRQSRRDLARWEEYQAFIRERSRRIGELNETEARVQEEILRRFIQWVQDNHHRRVFRQKRPLQVYEEIGRGVVTLEVDRERMRAESGPQDDSSREAKLDEFLALARRLRNYRRRFPYVIPVPAQGRDILVWGDPAQQRVFDELADELGRWAMNHYRDGDFTSSSPTSILATLVRLHEPQLRQAQLEPLVFEYIARTDVDWNIAARSFASTLGKAALIAGIVGVVVGAEILTAGQVTWVFVGLAAYMGTEAYQARRAEIATTYVDVPPAETIVHAAGDVIGLSQLIEGMTGIRLGTGQQLGTQQRSEAIGQGAGSVASLFVGSRSFRAGSAKGRAWRANARATSGAGRGSSAGTRGRPLPGPAEHFPFGSGRKPLPSVPNKVYRIMSIAEAAEAIRTNRLAGQIAGTESSKFVTLDSRYALLFRQRAVDRLAARGRRITAREASLEQLEARLAEARRAGDSARVAELEQNAANLRSRIEREAISRTEAHAVLEDWYRAPGQKVVVEIELQPGGIEHILHQAVWQRHISQYRGQDVYIWTVERSYGRNIGIPGWQLDNFNRIIVRDGIRMYAWRGVEVVSPQRLPGPNEPPN